jgi:hypothetical protein
VRVLSSLDGPGSTPDCPPGSLLVASIDVEWSKNYRITDGNRAFCYSIIWLTIPRDGRQPVDLARLRFDYTSTYLDHDGERRRLVRLAAADLAAAEAADHLVGHQLCSDLAVLTANTTPRTPEPVTAARTAWAARRGDPRGRIIDTRFDTNHLLSGRSRRLVDVCAELGLNVTQPELAGASMTALHRRWLATAHTEARERITVLNLRHSLSAALVALLAAGCGTWRAPLNVNAMLAAGLDGQLGWIYHPTFRALTEET